MEKEKVLVVGTGKSGIAATQLLLRTGKLPVLFDSNAELDKDEILGKLSLSGDEKKQVEIVDSDYSDGANRADRGRKEGTFRCCIKPGCSDRYRICK